MQSQSELGTQVAVLKQWYTDNVCDAVFDYASDEVAHAHLTTLCHAYHSFVVVAIDPMTKTLKQYPIEALGGLTPLQYAASHNFTRFLEKADASTLTKEIASNGRNLLHFAAAAAHLNTVILLLKKGVSANLADERGYCPIHLALMMSAMEDATTNTTIRTEIFNQLYQKLDDADKLAVNKYGENIAHFMATYGFETLIDALITADTMLTSAQAHDKQTPLHRAIINGHTHIALKLITAKLGINVTDANGKTPLDYAMENKNKTVIEALKKLPEAMSGQSSPRFLSAKGETKPGGDSGAHARNSIKS